MLFEDDTEKPANPKPATDTSTDDKSGDKDTDKVAEAVAGTAKNVASLSIPTILVALHQSALDHSKAAEKGVRIFNSAFDDKGDKSTLKSAGQHIISVIPEKPDIKFEKKDAIAILKEYVQWFVGPDLANKVNDSTVKQLDEAPNMKESTFHFMSFKRFLLEADSEKSAEDILGKEYAEEKKPEEKTTDKSAEEILDGDKKDDEKKDDSKKDDKTGDGKDGKKEDKAGKKANGYYIPYGMKIEGLKETALKDAMKKSAKTFFDDLTFTADGLFGGGDSFTVKDVKEKWNDAFGPVDPDDVVEKIRTQIEDISNPNTDRPTVQVRDKTTLISDLGKAITGKQKQMIDAAKYSIWIQLEEFDPKKPIFNRRVIADIVTSSIKGLWKKFKNEITADDVIYIENYADEHENTPALRELQQLIPHPTELVNQIEKAKNSNDAFEKIKTRMDKVQKHKQFRNSRLADACMEIWNQIKEKREKDSSAFSSATGNAKVEEFKAFIDHYKKAYEKFYDKKLDESINNLNKARYCIGLKDLILKDFLNEADSDDDKPKTQVNLEQIAKFSQEYISSSDISDPHSVIADNKLELQKICKILATPSNFIEQFGEFKYGILVDYTGQLRELHESVKDSILNILMGDMLYEDDPKDASDSKKDKDGDKKDKGKKKPSKKKTIIDDDSYVPPDPEKLRRILVKALEKNDVHEYADSLIEISAETLDESGSKPRSSPRFIFGQQNNDDMESKIEDEFTTKLQHIKINKDGDKGDLNKSVIGLFGPLEYIQSTLDKAGLYDQQIEQKMGENTFAFAVPIQLPLKDKNGKDATVPKANGKGTKKCKGTQGAQALNDDNTLAAMKAALDGHDIAAEVNNFFSYEKEAKDWPYFETNTPAKCKVFVGFIQPDEEDMDDSPEPSPTPTPTPTPPETDKTRKAYILPFGSSNTVVPDDIEDPDLEDDTPSGRTDLYLVPMKNMNYKDKEYNTYA